MLNVFPFLGLALGATVSDPEARAEQVMSRVAKEPVPSCETGHSEALANGVITIKPGQTICVSFQAQGDILVPTAIVEASEKKETLVIRFWKEDSAGDMFLALFNPFPSPLRYEAYMLLPDSSQHQHTSTCPVLSRRRNVEFWNIPVTELTISNFKLLPESQATACR